MLRDDAFQAELAGMEEDFCRITLQVLDQLQARAGIAQQARQFGFACL